MARVSKEYVKQILDTKPSNKQLKEGWLLKAQYTPEELQQIRQWCEELLEEEYGPGSFRYREFDNTVPAARLHAMLEQTMIPAFNSSVVKDANARQKEEQAKQQQQSFEAAIQPGMPANTLDANNAVQRIQQLMQEMAPLDENDARYKELNSEFFSIVDAQLGAEDPNDRLAFLNAYKGINPTWEPEGIIDACIAKAQKEAQDSVKITDVVKQSIQGKGGTNGTAQQKPAQ